MRGIKYQGEIILLMVFLISEWFESFRSNLFSFVRYFLEL
jgi:hypothetical protein